jgi:mannosyltransferase OCH1-like enzyme
VSPYITVMASTGPLFLSLCWKEWLYSHRGIRGDGKHVEQDRIRTLVPYSWGYGFFVNVEGRSWQTWDERVVAFLEMHWVFDVMLGVGSVVAVVGAVWRVFWWVLRWVRVRGRGWVNVVRWKWQDGQG